MPLFEPLANQEVSKGQLLSFTVSAQDSTGGALSYSAYGSLRDYFDPTTQTFSWIPNSADIGKTYNITFEVVNELGYDSEKSITITVNPQPFNTKIVFVKNYRVNETANFEIVTANPDGSDITKLTDEVLSPENPSWSPDGSKIAYSVYNGDICYNQIYVINLLDNSKTLITNGINQKWSQDGTKMVFERYMDEIYIRDMVTGTETLIANGQNPSWSPDGSRIVYNSNLGLDGYLTNFENIYSYDVATGAINKLDSIEGTNAAKPVYSPDGTKIAFNIESTSVSDVWFTYIMNADGSNTHKLLADGVFVENQSSENPSWSPDGNEIIFNDEFFIYMVGLDGKYVSSVGEASINGNLGIDPEWSPYL